jgi:integrase
MVAGRLQGSSACRLIHPLLSSRQAPGLTVEVTGRLLKVIERERLEASYVLALTTGQRRDELPGLRWEDADLVSRQLHVRRAIGKDTRRGVRGPTVCF